VTPPALSLPGPSVTICYQMTLAAYPVLADEFEQGFLNEYGPAQVELGPPFTHKLRPHRL
jgi:hypothetical protein